MKIDKRTLLKIIKEEVERSVADSKKDLDVAQDSYDSTMEAGRLFSQIRKAAMKSGSIEIIKKAKTLYNDKDIEGLKNILQDIS